MTPELRRLLRAPRPGQAAARLIRVEEMLGRIEAAQAIRLIAEQDRAMTAPRIDTFIDTFNVAPQWTYTWEATTYATAHATVTNLTLDIPPPPNRVVKGDNPPYPGGEPYWTDARGLTTMGQRYDWTQFFRNPQAIDHVPDAVCREVIRHNCRVIQGWHLKVMWRQWMEPVTRTMRDAAARRARALLTELVGEDALRYWAPSEPGPHRFIPVSTRYGAFVIVSGNYPKLRTLDVDEVWWRRHPIRVDPWARRRTTSTLRSNHGYCVTTAAYDVEGVPEAQELGLYYTEDDEAATIVLMLHANPEGLAHIAVPVQRTERQTNMVYRQGFAEVYGTTKAMKGRAIGARP